MLINTGNISRKVLPKVLRSFDKNFERLHAQRGYKKRVRGTEVDVMMQPKIKFEIVVSSEEWEKATIDAIQKAAFTGEVGDGKIFSYEIRTATKIRTRESGADALN